MMIDVPDRIENPEAYIAAAEARIARNAEIGRQRRVQAWIDADPSRKDVINFLENQSFGFLAKMKESMDKFGPLTEKQEVAVRKCMADKAAKIAEFRAKDAGSEWIGTEGVRQDFELTVRVVNYFEGDFGAVYINILNDAAGNVVVYKGGKPLGMKGDAVKVKATVKAHGLREGVKQTIISRPKVL